jgi:hypothetical protein
VVLIESKKSTSSPLPVQERVFYTIPFKQPVIDEILSQIVTIDINNLEVIGPIRANQRITVGDILVIRGKQLKRDPIAVLINGELFTPNEVDVSDTEVRIKIPASLKVGTLGVQIGHFIEMGAPSENRIAAESNLMAFVLSPTISNFLLNDVTGNIAIGFSANLSMKVNPGVYKGQRIMLLLNELNAVLGENPKSYSFILPASALPDEGGSVTGITFPILEVKSGDYLVRMQADGAESPLSRDTSGAYVGPTITIP